MKIALLTVLLLFSTTSISQVWVEPNANWHYDFWNIGYAGFYEMEYAQDSVVGGVLCQQIETTTYQFGYDQSSNLVLINTFSLPTQFTYVSGDTVFYWNENQFFTYLNFGAAIGDQWLIGTSSSAGSVCQDSSFVEVLETGSVSINSVNYRTITLASTDNSSLRLNGIFVERFGFMDSNQPFQPFPQTNFCDGAIYEWDIVSFKCFQDDAFSLYNPSGEECEYYLTHLGIEEVTTDKKELVKIVDFLGREVEHQSNVPLILIYSDGTTKRSMKLD